jgi:amidohydrolase
LHALYLGRRLVNQVSVSTTDPDAEQTYDDRSVLGDLRGLRRRLHRIPEVGLDLPQTQAALLDELAGLPVQVTQGSGLSSLMVTITGAQPGPTVLLRADMDALPVDELTGLKFASDNGAMHACGHDLHMASLIGAIRLLCARRDEFAGTVLAVFQPGEEGHGGARAMIDEGVLSTTGSLPVASYGVHVFSFLDPGIFSCRAGVVMGATLNIDIDVLGLGGHAARPYAAQNPVLVGAMIVQAIQTYVTQAMTPDDPIIATVGSFQSGDAANVIPDRARLRVSLRALTAERVSELRDRMLEIAAGIARGFDMMTASEEGPLLPPTVSGAADAELVEHVVGEMLGTNRYESLRHAEMIAEDFSHFLDATGGAFVFVGARAEEKPESNHSPRAIFDDSVVDDTSRVLAELAIRRLQLD